ncbi:hypothetical protein [Streptomyces noursei]|uniref:hypothetical protein n=1 Tax=Streptomyces noursei TaxID=1971 RepID=UPI001A929069|nr:hypothetical protein [Streptomyces noursei]
MINLVQTGTWQILGPALTERTAGRAVWGLVLSARGVGLLVSGAVLYRLAVGRLLAWGLAAGALGRCRCWCSARGGTRPGWSRVASPPGSGSA